jgi:transcriptional regulator with XRE-family HTH domain
MEKQTETPYSKEHLNGKVQRKPESSGQRSKAETNQHRNLRIRSNKHPPLGPIIAQILEEKGMSKAEFARRINTSRQNVSLILKKEHLDTQLLWTICQALDSDIFHPISLALDCENAPKDSKSGVLEIRLELADARLVQATVDLVHRIVNPTFEK